MYEHFLNRFLQVNTNMWNEVILQDATTLIEMGGPDALVAALALN